ncbi:MULTISPECIES: DUF4179 domain-containing protein [unclassified Paenibacillus]|uniref:DUF4179 domain-containing protein n=1 Tax=unclassified Paenibacillus TaxID=185978 RepID=UPI0009FA43DA|nr:MULTISPECIES: DUF4179 domain-containing protein [unclassified Paenibacillus]
MTNLKDWYVEELARKERPKLPDFDAMWERIQARVEASGAGDDTAQQPAFATPARRSVRKRMRLLPAAAAISTLLIAAPVVAGVTVGWPELFGRLGVTTAFNSGFGNPLKITMENEGVTVGLHGVVTDDNRLDVLFSATVPDMPDHDYVTFKTATLTDEKGRTGELQSLIRPGEEKGQLSGLLETENTLGWGNNSLVLTLGDLSFYRYTDNPLQVSPSRLRPGQTLATGTPYGSIAITSVERNGETVSVRYEIPVSPQATGQSHPHLFLKMGERRLTSSYAAVLPTDKPDIQFSQANFQLTEEEWEQASLHFSYLENIRTIKGTWGGATFEVNDAKAREATYRKKLDSTIQEDNISMKLKALTVTPLQIRIDYEEERGKPDFTQYDYRVKKLQVGERVIEGGLWHDDKSGWHLRFESPEWYKDWSNVPMKLLLSELVVQKRSTDLWMPLEQIDESRRTIEQTVDGFPVTFTYYRQGDDLVVESESPDDRFRGISQTAVNQGGERIYPPIEPMPPGGNGTNRRIQTYPGLLAKKGAIELSPGFYSYREPDITKEISLQ